MNQYRQGNDHEGQVNQLQRYILRQAVLDGVHQIVQRTYTTDTEPARQVTQAHGRLAPQQAKVNTQRAGDKEQEGGKANGPPAPGVPEHRTADHQNQQNFSQPFQMFVEHQGTLVDMGYGLRFIARLRLS